MNNQNDASSWNVIKLEELSNDNSLATLQSLGEIQESVPDAIDQNSGKGFGTNRAGNTRLNSQSGASDSLPLLSLMTVKIDGLRFVIPIQNQSDVDQMISDIEKTFKDKLSLKETDIVFINGRRFANRAATTRGGSLCWNLPGQNNDDGSLLVSVTGVMLSQCEERQKYELIARLLATHSVHFTRLDVALDDWTKFDPFDAIREAIEEGNYAGFRIWSEHTGNDSKNWRGRTIYLGSREATSFLRIYDKNAESHGKIASVRWELQAKYEKSQQIAECISVLVTAGSDDESIQRMLANYVVGQVQFIEKKDKNLSRCAILPWWREFKKRVGEGIKLAGRKAVITVEKKFKHIRRNFSTSLMQLYMMLGPTDFHEAIDLLVAIGDDKAQKHHYSFIDVAKEELKTTSWKSMLN